MADNRNEPGGVVSVDGPTPAGGVRAEYHYFSDALAPVTEAEATRCVVRELDHAGELLGETWAYLTPPP